MGFKKPKSGKQKEEPAAASEGARQAEEEGEKRDGVGEEDAEERGQEERDDDDDDRSGDEEEEGEKRTAAPLDQGMPYRKDGIPRHTIQCRFWRQGHCRNDSCAYVHDLNLRGVPLHAPEGKKPKDGEPKKKGKKGGEGGGSYDKSAHPCPYFHGSRQYCAKGNQCNWYHAWEGQVGGPLVEEEGEAEDWGAEAWGAEEHQRAGPSDFRPRTWSRSRDRNRERDGRRRLSRSREREVHSDEASWLQEVADRAVREALKGKGRGSKRWDRDDSRSRRR